MKRLDAFVAKHAKKVLKPADWPKVNRFTKAYHEIRYNIDKTTYFPNFDEFNDDQKRAHIALINPKKAAELAGLSTEELNELFQVYVRHEISDLERDMMEVFS